MSGAGVVDYALHPAIDRAQAAAEFAAAGRTQIAPFLAERGAAALLGDLKRRRDWKLVLNAGDTVYEVPRHGPSALAPEQEARLRGAVHAAARTDFQYCYESVRVPDADPERSAADPLHGFARFLSSAPVLDLLRGVAGAADIAFADAQATAYGPGDLLTAHDDAVAGKHRRAAYVFGLTERWRTEWGGLLLFHDARGDIVRGYGPAMNALSLFAVPQVHSVSLVAGFAAHRRYSVTGWLRGLG